MAAIATIPNGIESRYASDNAEVIESCEVRTSLDSIPARETELQNLFSDVIPGNSIFPGLAAPAIWTTDKRLSELTLPIADNPSQAQCAKQLKVLIPAGMSFAARLEMPRQERIEAAQAGIGGSAASQTVSPELPIDVTQVLGKLALTKQARRVDTRRWFNLCPMPYRAADHHVEGQLS